MTSNYIEQLDRALIRPGRIDIIADFKKCVNTTLIEMMEFFFDIQLTDSEKKQIFGLNEYIVSPAEMGKIMFENFNDYTNSIAELERISNKTNIEEIPDIQPLDNEEKQSIDIEQLVQKKQQYISQLNVGVSAYSPSYDNFAIYA
jgi:hypothetical protein